MMFSFNRKRKAMAMNTRRLISLILFMPCLAAPTWVGAAGPFAVSANGKEVTDTKTGLIWRRCAEGMSVKGNACTGKALQLDHDAAVAYADKQAGTTRVTWRLPDLSELKSIADEGRANVAIDTAAFPATPADYFWTSQRIDHKYAFSVNFVNGLHYDRYHTSPHFMRLVRDPQ
jgi:hypothetical protein